MRIAYSAKITEILTEYANRKRLKYIRPLAIFVTPSNTATAMEMIKIICEKYPGIPDLVRGIATTSGTEFFFDEPEEVIIRKLTALKVPRKGKTAPKVIVRMIYSRMVKLQNSVDNLKQIQASGGYARYGTPNVTRESSLDMAFWQFTTPHIRRLAGDLIAVTAREDVTRGILDQAVDLFQTHTIMKS